MKYFRFLVLVFCILNFFTVGYTKIIDRIVTTVDGQIVTLSELQDKLIPLIEQYRSLLPDKELEEKVNTARKEMLNELIEEKILIIKAQEAEIEVSNEEVEEAIEQVKKSFPAPEDFYSELERQGKTFSDLEKEIRIKIKLRKFVKWHILKDIRITEEEISQFYKENKDSYFVPGKVNISQILIKNSYNERGEKIIEEILEKLKEGEDFSALARKYSQGPSAKGGGSLGFVYLEELHPNIRKALSSIEVGKYTKPIRTTAGYHIIKLEARSLPRYIPLSEVKKQIRAKLYDVKAGKLYDEWMEKAKKEVEIVVFE